jgi:hypothetical protein
MYRTVPSTRVSYRPLHPCIIPSPPPMYHTVPSTLVSYRPPRPIFHIDLHHLNLKFCHCEAAPTFYVHSVFIAARHVILSWARLIQSTPFPLISVRPISILYCHTRLGSSRKPLVFSYLIRLHAITQIIFGEEYKSLISSLRTRSCLQSPVTVSFLHSSISLGTLLSETFALWHLHKIRNQVSHPCEASVTAHSMLIVFDY